MKLLLDMGMAPRTAVYLNQLGHDAAHLRDRGQTKLSDQSIVGEAEQEGRIVVTFDLDFARIVALSAVGETFVDTLSLGAFHHGRGQCDPGQLVKCLRDRIASGCDSGRRSESHSDT